MKLPSNSVGTSYKMEKIEGGIFAIFFYFWETNIRKYEKVGQTAQITYQNGVQGLNFTGMGVVAPKTLFQ